MPFTLDSEVAAALGAMMGPDGPPPPIPAGDVQSRRSRLDAMFSALASLRSATPDISTKDFHVAASDGHTLICRWYTKNNSPLPGSAIVYAHGGGMIALTIEQYDERMRWHVSRTGVPMLMVDYRLCPEVRAPTPVTDVYAGLKYLVDHAQEMGVDPSRICIMGDSAGGGITASLAHYIKQQGGPAVKKQILIYPMLDDRNVEVDPALAPFATWTTDDNITGWSALLEEKRGTDKVTPIEAAARMTVADAEGLPPCFIDVGELDLFRDESLEYARKLGTAGVEVEFHLYPQVPHAYEVFAPESAVARRTMEARLRAIEAL